MGTFRHRHAGRVRRAGAGVSRRRAGGVPQPGTGSGKTRWKIAAAAPLLLIALSGLRIGFLPYYEKDNYAGAAQTVRINPDRRRYLYQGDRITFLYYRISRDLYPNMVQINNITIKQFDRFRKVDRRETVVILANKPEFDRHHLWKHVKGRNEQRLNIFRIIEL